MSTHKESNPNSDSVLNSCGKEESAPSHCDRAQEKEKLHHTIEEMESANEEIISMNEELQATNEELETSKEALQSLNEELTTVNSQLQNKLEQLETVNNDLNNLLACTDIAILFLDRRLHIKHFTPATRRLFNLISTDLGRPINDISHKFRDSQLLYETKTVLDRLIPLEKEVRTVDNRWYLQRTFPYQTQNKRLDGVVATFIDITERKQAEEALHEAKAAAEQANNQKSQLLAAASHDLRQPLQTLNLLNAALLKQIRNQEALALLNHQSKNLQGMGDLLNALLDVSQIEAGTITPKLSVFSADELFRRLKDEFETQAREKGLGLRVRSCPIMVYSDRALLERILHNLLSNALRYTESGKILVACRRRGLSLHIEVWDTGCGFPQDQLETLFTEFCQLKKLAQERNKGLGLGLAIVDRLIRLLDHRLHIRSTPGKGSMFAVEVPIATGGNPHALLNQKGEAERQPKPIQTSVRGTILLIEDDPAVADSLAVYLKITGFQLIQTGTGDEALAHMRDKAIMPDLIISDYRLPGGKNGLEVIRDIRQVLGRDIPAILLTGDTASIQLRGVEEKGYRLLRKPVAGDKIVELLNQLITKESGCA